MEMISSVIAGKRIDDFDTIKDDGPQLDFQDGRSGQTAWDNDEVLRSKALQNLRERRLRLKSSAIFNA